MGAVTDVTDATFDEVVLKSDKPVVVDFWADWCGPCKQVSPIIEELANAHGDKVTVREDGHQHQSGDPGQQLCARPADDPGLRRWRAGEGVQGREVQVRAARRDRGISLIKRLAS